MQIRVGSNVFHNSNGVIVVQDREQVVVEIRPESAQLLLTLDLYGESRERIAHLRGNRWLVNEQDRFSVATSPAAPPLFPAPAWVIVKDRASGAVVLEAQAEDRHTVTLVWGHLYSSGGRCLDITPHYWRLDGGVARFGEIRDLRGQAVSLGD